MLSCFLAHTCTYPVRAGGRVNTQNLFVPPIGERLNMHFWFVACSGGWLVNTPLVAWHKSGWRVYTHLLLGVNSTTGKRFRKIGTANNEWVHYLCWYLPNLFIEHLFFWRSSHGFVKTDLYPLYRGLLIYVRDTVFSTLRWSTYRPLLRACQRSNVAEERRP